MKKYITIAATVSVLTFIGFFVIKSAPSFAAVSTYNPLEKLLGLLVDRLGQIEQSIKALDDSVQTLDQNNQLAAQQPLLGARDSQGCQIATSSVVTVTQTSQVMLATSSSRAWARIHQIQATSTIYLNMSGGPAVVAASSTTIALNATTTSPFIDFGLNTQLPYTGAVTGVVDIGSTAVRVTECNYK